MAITSLDQYKNLISTSELIPVNVASVATVAGRAFDLWRVSYPQPAVPGAAITPDRTTLGALGQQNAGSGTSILLAARWNSLNPGTYLICDRLSHTGGLSGAVATEQTTNLPTATLTRYTDGVGVMCGLSIYTAVGNTIAVASICYTNTTPTSGQVSPQVVFGGTGNKEANRIITIPYLDQDQGITSVQSVTLSLSTATAGAFGVTLFKPLYMVCVSEVSGIANVGFMSGSTGGGIPEITDDACLFPICISGGANGMLSGALITGEI